MRESAWKEQRQGAEERAVAPVGAPRACDDAGNGMLTTAKLIIWLSHLVPTVDDR